MQVPLSLISGRALLAFEGAGAVSEWRLELPSMPGRSITILFRCSDAYELARTGRRPAAAENTLNSSR